MPATSRCCVWGLRTGWKQGLGVAAGLGPPDAAAGPDRSLRGRRPLAAGVALPLAFARVVGPGARC